MPLEAVTRGEIVDRIMVRILGRDAALTDFTVISTLRIIVEEAIAEEFAALNDGLVRAQRRRFIDTAEGADLDRLLADFGLTRPAAIAAYGNCTFTVSQASVVPQGAIVRTTAGQQYRVLRNPIPDGAGEPEGDWAILDTREIPVEAIAAGTAGNCAAGTIVSAQGINHITSVTNASPFINGRNALRDDEFRQFFKDFLVGLKRSPRGALLHHVRTFTDPLSGRRVHSAALQEWDGTTLLDAGARSVALKLFIDEGVAIGAHGIGTADSALVAAVQRLVDGADTEEEQGYRGGGIPTAVEPARALAVPVIGTIDIDSAYNVESIKVAALDALLRFFAALPVAGTTPTGGVQGQFSRAHMIRSVLDVPGVLAAAFTQPVSDIAVPHGYKAIALDGGIDITGRVA